MDQKNFFEGKINAVNVGTGIFHTGMREQNVAAVQGNWRPPVDAKLIKLLRKCDETGLSAKIDEANQRVYHALLDADPVWVAIRPAREVVPGMDQKIVLHSGPDCTFEELSSIHRKGVVGAALHEKWAVSREDAEDKFRRNEIKLGACNDHATVGAGAGILSPSMPVLICRDMHNGNEGYCLPWCLGCV